MPTWDTAADWDGAAAESGVVHESVTNTDHDDATTVKMGYSAASPYKPADLHLYYPLHEDSGSTAHDFSGDGYDATANGNASPGATAPLGTSAWTFDGSADYLTPGVPGTPNRITLCCWFNADSASGRQALIDWGFHGSNGEGAVLALDGNEIHVRWGGGNNSFQRTTSTVGFSTGNWHFVGFAYAAQTGGSDPWRIYYDGGIADSGNVDGTDISGASRETRLGYAAFGGWAFGGEIWDSRAYRVGLTESEFDTLYETVATAGSLTTGWK